MLQEPFSHKFPEWQLDQALKDAAGGPLAFWHHAIVHSPNNSESLMSLAQWFPGATDLVLENQAAFAKDAASQYGIDPERYRHTYWGLRPDFTVRSRDFSTVIFLEAKGCVTGKSWIDPKAIRYYEFLKECNAATAKGLFYIVPSIVREDCIRCLRTYFSNEPSIRTGVIFWEDLLPLIHERLLRVAFGYILTNMEGIKSLYAWQCAAV